MTEFNREKIIKARLVANAGCYVIATMLGLAPLLSGEMVELHNLPINAINGTTGASSKPQKDIMHFGVFGNVLSYSMEGHRHSAELEEQIRMFRPVGEIKVNFNASHGNFTRGIHSVASPLVNERFRDKMTREFLLELYEKYYKREFFIRVVGFEKKTTGTTKEYDIYPQIKNVRGTNFCDIGLDYDRKRGIVKVVAVADNLVKGSAGSAVQNMNVMFGFDEKTGLTQYSAT